MASSTIKSNMYVDYTKVTNISSYDSATNAFTVPKDGYIRVIPTISDTTNTGFGIFINGQNFGGYINANCSFNLIYPVKRQVEVYFTTQSNVTLTAYFYENF